MLSQPTATPAAHFAQEPSRRSNLKRLRTTIAPLNVPTELSLPLFHLTPPYERPARCVVDADEFERLPAGTVLLLEMNSEPRDWQSLHQSVMELRQSAPRLPIALRIDAARVDVLNAAVQLARMPVRAVLGGGEDYETALRRQLTRPTDLATDVVDWLAIRGTRLPPALRHLLHGIFSMAPQTSTVAPLLLEIGTSESSARFRLQKKGLPPPGRWLQAARAVHAALHLQARPDRPLLPLALSLGYADHSALSHLLGRAFCVRPAEIRDRLGWEWLLDRWLRISIKRVQPTR